MSHKLNSELIAQAKKKVQNQVKRKRRWRLFFVISYLLLFALFITAVLYALRQDVSYYRTPMQIKMIDRMSDKKFRLGGVVQKNSIQHLPNGYLTFILADKEAQIKVIYRGIIPNLFAEGETAIVEGSFKSPDLFQRQLLLAKHDETYRPVRIKE